jgi:hypothetical protein
MYISHTDQKDVGELYYVGTKPNMKGYIRAICLREVDDGNRWDGKILMASVPENWNKSVRFLKDRGFIQCGKAEENPNSGNMIILFYKSFSAKELAVLKKKSKNYDY